MHIKFTSHGSGSGSVAVNYLLGEKDHRGEVREQVQILRGDPEMCGQLIDALDFKNRYRSAVIAFHEHDKPTVVEINELLYDFQMLAFAGLEGDQYTWSAVLHTDKNGTPHIHVIAPCVELRSGTSFNCAPPGWQKAFYPLRDAFNAEKGWANPKDPRLSRIAQPGNNAAFEGWRKCVDHRQVVAQLLTKDVLCGRVNSREDVVARLQSFGGMLTRQGADFLSFSFEGGKPIRFKGPFYEREFDGGDWRAAANTARVRQPRRDAPDTATAERARAELASAIDSRARRNVERYSRARSRIANILVARDALARAATEVAQFDALLPQKPGKQLDGRVRHGEERRAGLYEAAQGRDGSLVEGWRDEFHEDALSTDSPGHCPDTFGVGSDGLMGLLACRADQEQSRNTPAATGSADKSSRAPDARRMREGQFRAAKEKVSGNRNRDAAIRAADKAQHLVRTANLEASRADAASRHATGVLDGVSRAAIQASEHLRLAIEEVNQRLQEHAEDERARNEVAVRALEQTAPSATKEWSAGVQQRVDAQAQAAAERRQRRIQAVEEGRRPQQNGPTMGM